MYFEGDFPQALLNIVPRIFPHIEDRSGLSGLALKALSPTPLHGPGIDLGCGDGFFALQAARTLGIEILAVDRFQPLVSRAAEVAKDYAPTCKFLLADVYDLLDDPNNHCLYGFSVALSPGNMFATPCKGLILASRLVRPGGYVVLGWSSPASLHSTERRDLISAGITLGRIAQDKRSHFIFDAVEEVRWTREILDDASHWMTAKEHSIFQQWILTREQLLYSAHEQLIETSMIMIQIKSV